MVKVVVALTLMVVSAANAQEQRGAIEGAVRDTQGAVVAGVAVAARGATGFAADRVTDASGVYRFASLPPGRYEVVARLDGFVPARVVDIELALGVQLRIDRVIEPAGPSETLEVVSESPLIAVTQSARAINIRDEQIERLPQGRDFTSLAIQAPGVNDERKLSGISIDGSSGAENRIVIDGVETTDTWFGTPGQFLVTDFIEELQVKSSGYSAEYGGSTGGVLNAITKAGSNVWRGEALLYWSGNMLDAAPRPTLQLAPIDRSRAEHVTFPEDHYHQVEPGFTLGGPIVRERIWFFGGYIPSFRPLERTVTFLTNGTTRRFRQDLRRHHAAVNMSARLGPRWRAKTTFSTGRQTQRGLLPSLDGASNPAADYSIDTIDPNYSASASVDFTPNSHALVSFRTGYFFKDLFNEGVYRGDRYLYQTSSVGFPGVPTEYQQPGLYSNVPSNTGRDKGKGPHLGLQVDGTLFFSAAGQHQLKGGVQFDRVGLDTLAGDTGNSILFYWGQSFNAMRGPFGYYRIFSSDRRPNQGFITEGDATVHNLGLFIQDAWNIGKTVTIHLGLRTENEVVPSLSTDPRVPRTAIRFGFADKLAPRLGFAWDVNDNRQTKIYGSWGVFYDITKLQISFGFGGFSLVNNWYTLDSGDIGAIVDNPDCPPACPGRLIRGPVGSTVLLNNPDDNRIDPDLKQTRLQEAVVGVEHVIAPKLSVGARYIHKQVERALEDVGTQDARLSAMTIVRIGNPGFGNAATFFPPGATTPIPLPKARRDYDAVEVSIDRRLFQRWSGRISYTWSRLHGNYSGLAQSDEDGRVAPNIGLSFDYPLRSFDERGTPVYGVLATDRTHQTKAHFLYDFPFGTSVGARWFGASGIPRTREASFMPGILVMYRGRNSDGRLPFLSQFDVHLQHQLRAGDRYSLTLSGNVTNLINQGAATNYHASELFTGQSIAFDEAKFYEGIDTQTLIAEQRLVRDARFLMDSGYQAPRSIRLAVKFGF
jgi:Carboxypeptidase regulatory-like domain/TonB-dependent Receptor Plug Domain